MPLKKLTDAAGARVKDFQGYLGRRRGDLRSQFLQRVV